MLHQAWTDRDFIHWFACTSVYFICPVLSKLTHLKICPWRREIAEPGIRDSGFGIATTSRGGRSKIRNIVIIGASDKADVGSILCVIEWRNREAAQQVKKNIMWISVTREIKVVEQERQQGRKCETESEEFQGVERLTKEQLHQLSCPKYVTKKSGRGNMFFCSPKCPNQLWDPIRLIFNEYFFFLEKSHRDLMLTTHL